MIAGSLEAVYASVIDAAAGQQRILVGIAGPPGAGKSTLSSLLCRRLNDTGHLSAIVPMDGFHLDNSTLRERGLLDRKGAPETFDARGFITLAQRLRDNRAPIAIPVFDREADCVHQAKELVAAECKVVLLEGNYLLLDRPPWTELPALLDLSILVTAPKMVLQERLIQRWLDLGHGRRTAEERANGNDIPNATLVLNQSNPADISCAFEPAD
jgi:pantothenate kinase